MASLRARFCILIWSLSRLIRLYGGGADTILSREIQSLIKGDHSRSAFFLSLTTFTASVSSFLLYSLALQFEPGCARESASAVLLSTISTLRRWVGLGCGTQRLSLT